MESTLQNVREKIVVPYDESLIKYWDSIEKYKRILRSNLDFMFYQLCNDESAVDMGFQVIRGVTLPFRQMNIRFSIEVTTEDFQGYFTAYCPELEGCITEGATKMEALDNLCYAMSESLILNYDVLKIDVLNNKARPPKMTPGFFIQSDYYSYNYINILRSDSQYRKLYLGKKHLLVKNDTDEKITLTLRNEGFHILTKHLLGKVVGIEK